MRDCLLDDTALANRRTLSFFPITSTMKYKPNFASEWLAHLILIWNHQFQISGCKVAVSTDCFVALHILSSKTVQCTIEIYCSLKFLFYVVLPFNYNRRYGAFQDLRSRVALLVKQSLGCMECKFPSLVSLLIEINPVHNLIPYLFRTHFIILPSLPSCPSFFKSRFVGGRNTRQSHLSDFITVVGSDAEYKL